MRQQPTLPHTSRLILESALLGCADVAARLIAALNNYDYYHHPRYRLKPLWFLWNLRAKEEGVAWPDGEERKVQDAVRARRRLHECGNERDDTAVTSDDLERELNLTAQWFASKWYYPGKLTGSDCLVASDRRIFMDQATVEQKLDAACEIIRSFDTGGAPTKINDLQSGLVNALDLVLSAQAYFLERKEIETLNMRGAPTPEELWKWTARCMGDKYYEQRYLPEFRHVWKLLKIGTLRKLLNIDEEVFSAFVSQVESAITDRLVKGRERPASSLDRMPTQSRTAQHTNQSRSRWPP
jgi:hypothetical protein